MKNNFWLLVLLIGFVIFATQYAPEMAVYPSEKYLIITSSSFSQEIQPLIDYRKLEYDVRILYVTPSWTPEQIKQQIGNSNYVFIIGDKYLVQSKLIIEQEGTEWEKQYYSDTFYSDDNGDYVPERAVGRIPFKKETDVTNYVTKLINYEQRGYYLNNKALFIGGSEANPPTGFKTCSMYRNNVYSILDMPYDTFCPYYLTGEIPFQYNSIEEALNTIDYSYVTYTGHGSYYDWYVDGVANFNAQDATVLNNQNSYPIVLALACKVVNIDGTITSIHNVGLAKPNAGFISYIGTAPTSGGYTNWVHNFFVYIKTENTIGDVFVKTKTAEPEILNRNQFQLLGDPALVINGARPTPPSTPYVCDSNSDGSISRTELAYIINRYYEVV